MISNRFKILWFLLFIYLTVLVFRFDLILGLLKLSGMLMILLFSGSNNISRQIDFNLLDSVLSALFFIIVPTLILSIKKLRLLLNKKLTPSGLILILLAFAFIHAPIITNQHPDFQKNISVTKLLPPLTSVNYILLQSKENNSDEYLQKFIEQKNKFVHQPFNDKIIFIDSLDNQNEFTINSSTDREVVYYQSGVVKSIPLSALKTENGKPVIFNKMFWLGSDEYGRDIFSRLVYGSRISMLVGFGSVLITLLIGVAFAFIAEQNGKFIDVMISRFADLFLSLPAVFLVIMILAFFGSNLFSVIVVLGLSGWMSLFKIVKTEIISVKKKDYFLTAELIGLSKHKLLIREIMPVIIIPVVVNLVFQFSNVILAESALSYLGLGTGTSYPSWGAMIESGQEYISQSWWMIFIPGIILIITLLSINDMGQKIVKYYNPKYQL